ncbi:hypothetical protein JXM83_04325 [Candidatus Woesearchaeota archaeon]|nr:hypothetical protein [Candidatus Woesearchaeota archaeon]
MIGNSKWFTYRIFGWGLRPKTKEGWLYILILVGILFGITLLPIQQLYKTYTIIAIVTLVLLDTMHIMMQLGKHHDERERYHQLLIERNCSFAAIAALIGIVIYDAITNPTVVNNTAVIVLCVMVLTKIGSWIYVKKFF